MSDDKEEINLSKRQLKRRKAWDASMFNKHDYVQKINDFISKHDQRTADRDKRRIMQGIKK